jgi:hypothetical protein
MTLSSRFYLRLQLGITIFHPFLSLDLRQGLMLMVSFFLLSEQIFVGFLRTALLPLT